MSVELRQVKRYKTAWRGTDIGPATVGEEYLVLQCREVEDVVYLRGEKTVHYSEWKDVPIVEEE